ncbi:MAG TPA: DUF4412 domain-containing protein [Flavipsychrobacter sp.]
MKQIILFSAIMLTSIHLYAQPGRGYVRDAIERKYEDDNKGSKAKGEAWLSDMMNGKTESSYSFPISINMHVTSYKDGEKKDESDILYYLNGSQKYFGFKPVDEKKKKKKDEMFMIYDNKNNSMITLNDDEKTGMAININSFMSADAQARRGQGYDNGPISDVKCNKTGKTKTILGYTCSEYVCIDEERNRKTEVWVTTKLNIDISQSFARSPYSYLATGKNTGGFMMEATHYKNNQIESKMEVTNVNESANVTKNISDYKMGPR